MINLAIRVYVINILDGLDIMSWSCFFDFPHTSYGSEMKVDSNPSDCFGHVTNLNSDIQKANLFKLVDLSADRLVFGRRAQNSTIEDKSLDFCRKSFGRSQNIDLIEGLVRFSAFCLIT